MLLIAVDWCCSSSDLSLIWKPSYEKQRLHYGWPVYSYENNSVQWVSVFAILAMCWLADWCVVCRSKFRCIWSDPVELTVPPTVRDPSLKLIQFCAVLNIVLCRVYETLPSAFVTVQAGIRSAPQTHVLTQQACKQSLMIKGYISHLYMPNTKKKKESK